MLTNFRTIRKRIDRKDQLAKMQENGTFELLPKKEVAKLELFLLFLPFPPQSWHSTMDW